MTVYGFGWCNPAFNDGRGAMTTEEYIKTCPDDWFGVLFGMRQVADQMFGPEGWKIVQIKTKFGEPRVYLDVTGESTLEKRHALNALEAFAELAIRAVIDAIEAEEGAK